MFSIAQIWRFLLLYYKEQGNFENEENKNEAEDFDHGVATVTKSRSPSKKDLSKEGSESFHKVYVRNRVLFFSLAQINIVLDCPSYSTNNLSNVPNIDLVASKLVGTDMDWSSSSGSLVTTTLTFKYNALHKAPDIVQSSSSFPLKPESVRHNVGHLTLFKTWQFYNLCVLPGGHPSQNCSHLSTLNFEIPTNPLPKRYEKASVIMKEPSFLLNFSSTTQTIWDWTLDHPSRKPLRDPKMVGKIVRSSGEVNDAESHYKPPKKGSKDDPIVLSDSEEVDLENELEDINRKWDATFDVMLDEE
ncbi:hypothetical protein FNV43_RR07453 [Rhamnella rubrinervis]|uniref:Uncharacterized protein n=1 Tax=Rhamnella rubrinervis TaxID=2594499 RepID=A0A8K0MMR0_9ROSA|nr:hypothetical protein FNV43_RR07453 [Rhamnella rubrinervis]